MAETQKIKARFIRDKVYDKYIKLPVIDIGVGRIDAHDGEDTIHPKAKGWDKDDGDATLMEGVADEHYQTVYCSHVLEHLVDPITAIKNWYRILKAGGLLIISIPHRDLYEKKRTLPSLWNEDHKYFFLPEESDPPHTFSFKNIIETALKGLDYEIVEFKIDDEGWKEVPVNEHSVGSYSIEAIIKKGKHKTPAK